MPIVARVQVGGGSNLDRVGDAHVRPGVLVQVEPEIDPLAPSGVDGGDGDDQPVAGAEHLRPGRQ